MFQKANNTFVFGVICAEKNKNMDMVRIQVLLIENGCSNYTTRHGGL